MSLETWILLQLSWFTILLSLVISSRRYRQRMSATVQDLQDKLRYRQNEVDALSNFNDVLAAALRREGEKNKLLREECKSFAASVLYWKKQADKSLLGDEGSHGEEARENQSGTPRAPGSQD